MASLLKFGDVFTFAEAEYVFLGLAVNASILYAAKVLDTELTGEVLAAEKRAQKKPDYHKNLLYCFVVLTSAEFAGRIAHLVKTDDAGITIGNYSDKLNSADSAALRKEILEGPLPAKLKEIISATTEG